MTARSSVVQEAQQGVFMEGDRVNVAVGSGVTRVSMVTGADTRDERGNRRGMSRTNRPESVPQY